MPDPEVREVAAHSIPGGLALLLGLIGFLLGPLIEQNFLRAMLLGKGDFLNLLHRPIAASLLALTVVILAFMAWGALRPRLARRAAQS